MSNSGNESFGVPSLPGYDVEWDQEALVFVATHETRGHELRGRDRAELNAARARRLAELGEARE